MLKKSTLFIWRSISHLLVAVLLLLFVAWSVLVLLAHSASGSRWLLEKVVQLQKLVKFEVIDGTLIEGVRLKNFRFTGKTFYLDAQSLQLKLTWAALLAKEFRVNQLYGQGVNLVLHAPPKTGRTHLKYLNIPLRIVLEDGVLTQSQIDKRGFIIPIERLALASSSWYHTQLDIGSLDFIHPLFNTQLQGKLYTEKDYPIVAKGLLQAKFWQDKDLKPLYIKGEGDFGALQLNLLAHDLPVALNGTVNLLEPTLDYIATLRWGNLNFPWLTEQNFRSRYGKLQLNGTKHQLSMVLTTNLQSKILPQGEYRTFAQSDWHKIQLQPLEARTLLGGLLSLQGDVAWQKGITWNINSQWSDVDLSKKWPALQHYLPKLSGNIQTKGETSATHSAVTLSSQLANKEQWQIRQQSNAWFWHWQDKQQLQVSWQNIARSLPALSKLESQHGQLDYQGSLNDYRLRLKTALQSSKTPQGDWQLEAQGNRQQLMVSQLNYQGESGTIQAKGQLAWHNGLTWDSQLKLQQLHTIVWQPNVDAVLSGSTELSGKWMPDTKQLQLAQSQLTGYFNNTPLKIDSKRFSIDIKPFSLTHFPAFDSHQTDLTWGKNKLLLNGGLAANTWNVVADVQLDDMTQLSSKARGQVNGQLFIQGEQQHPSLTIDLHGKDVSYENKISFNSVELAGSLNQLGQHQSELQMTVHNMEFAERIVPDAAIAIKGTQDKHHVTWQLLAQPVVAEGQLQGSLDSRFNWQGQSQDGLVKVGDFLWVLQKPFAVQWETAKKQVSASEHCWQADQAQLCNQDNLHFSPEQAHVNIALKDLEISRLSALFPEDLAWQGSLKGQAIVDWQANQRPQLNALLVTDNGEIGLTQEEGEAITLPYHQLRLTARNNEDNHIALRFDMQAPNMGQGYIDARIDPQSSPYQMNGAMLLEKVNLAILKPFLPNMRHLAGEINLSGGLTGEITRPDFYGEFSLKDGEVLAKNIAIDISQTNINASIRGKNATIKGSLKSGGGIANLQGKAQWYQEIPNLSLSLEGQHIDLVQKPLFTAKVSPNIKLNIQPYLIDIKGDALVEEALLQPQMLANNAVPLSADVRIVDWLNNKRLVVAKKTSKQWDINADIELVMGDKVFFNGFGLQSKLLGNLKLKQQKQRGMQAIGEIQLDKEAKYEAYGQRLNIRQGQILFAGSISQPALAIEAIKEVDGKIVGVRVDGRANLPNLTLFADTAMSQDEMLGYLLLGRPLYQDGQLAILNQTGTSNNDSALLASAALSLGVKGGQGLASGIGTALGVKDVTLNAEGSGDDAQFTVSGYLTPSLYLRYGVGVFTPVNKVTLRYKLTKNLYLEAISSLESALDLFYNFKF